VSDDQTNFGAFDDIASARRLSTAFISSGADIIMPVDGTSGNKAAGQAAQRTQGVLLIGVDTDQHFSTPEYDALWLTSAVKNYRVMVYDAMGMVVHHDFRGGLLVGTVANRGVGLAPFYQFAQVVPATLTTKLKELDAGIANGSISVDPASYIGG
jgi:basic membrane protein A